MQDRPYIALGLMSGTSLDGIDAAFIETDGVNVLSFGPSLCVPYPDRKILEDTIKAALQWGFEGPPPVIFKTAQDFIDRAHMRIIRRICTQHPDWGQRLDVIGYHGQTVLHHPAKDGFMGQTLQLGDGHALAAEFGVPCVYDFRSADVEAGGQGAPLAPIYHEAISKSAMFFERVAVVNIGGVANATFIDPDEALRATDCGAGNGPLDSWVQKHGLGTYDKNGAAALAGRSDQALIDGWLSKGFFTRPMPRSADRYDFDVLADMDGMSVNDGAATLAAFCVQGIARDLKDFAPQTVIICGGGRHNPAIMQGLTKVCEGKVMTSEDVAWDGDALEAQAFAYLAVRSLIGLPNSFKGTTGVKSDMRGGVTAQS